MTAIFGAQVGNHNKRETIIYKYIIIFIFYNINIILYYVILYYIILHYITFHYITLYQILLYYDIIVCYILLYYINIL